MTVTIRISTEAYEYLKNRLRPYNEAKITEKANQIIMQAAAIDNGDIGAINRQKERLSKQHTEAATKRTIKFVEDLKKELESKIESNDNINKLLTGYLADMR